MPTETGSNQAAHLPTMANRIVRITAALGGWILLALLAWHFRERLLFKVESLFLKNPQENRWEAIIQARKSNLSEVPWKDGRPLILMLGDSQMEMGDWYDLFQGRFAIRNAGLSQAKIKDVARLADEISRIKPAMVILMCGINDLGAGHSVNTALEDYIRLLDGICLDVGRSRVVVLSIMPVARNRIADGSTKLNDKVEALNSAIHDHCQKRDIAFLDVSSAISEGGALGETLTWDGLHLNPTGYQKLADRMNPLLIELYAEGQGK